MDLNRFVDLPREIRNMIHEKAFECYYVHPNYRYRGPGVSHRHKGRCLYDQRHPIAEQEREPVLTNDDLALLLANRQISAEVSPVFYKKALFTGTELTDDGLFSSIKRCSSDRANMIRTIEFGPTSYDKPNSTWSGNYWSSILEALHRP